MTIWQPWGNVTAHPGYGNSRFVKWRPPKAFISGSLYIVKEKFVSVSESCQAQLSCMKNEILRCEIIKMKISFAYVTMIKQLVLQWAVHYSRKYFSFQILVFFIMSCISLHRGQSWICSLLWAQMKIRNGAGVTFDESLTEPDDKTLSVGRMMRAWSGILSDER